MRDFLDRLRGAWDELNDREKRLVGALGIVLAAFVLGLPLFWTAHQNSELEQENQQLRSVLQLIGARRAQLEAIAQARRSAEALYVRTTPPLGSFLEEQGEKKKPRAVAGVSLRARR